ncbi:MAG: helix-turn-helix transcriptional regulator [Hyphomicrobiales bacterium]|nr:helix-turn-helix transcriptional regulator [Hyphomicrobiales bacterium]MCY4048133.1 helix-turn-helix transcriptional regulator [Hyphomicrobiales bacterium]MCY4052624.1 helix-turn-helix transcriptional regulator [Hyphomicrobiales bacterium]
MAAEKIEAGSGNVFADVGFADADTHLLKAGIVARIDKILRRRRLTDKRAAKLFDLSHEELSRLVRGHFRKYSVERLLHLLTILGQDVEIITHTAKTQRQGRLSFQVV